MSSYNLGTGAVNISLNAGGAVYPRISEDGEPFGYENVQDLIDVEQLNEIRKIRSRYTNSRSRRRRRPKSARKKY